MKKLWITAAAWGLAIGIGMLAATPATAASAVEPADAPASTDIDITPQGIPWTEYTMLNKTTLSTAYVNNGQLLGQCQATNGTCTISVTVSATRTIGTALGATFKWGAGQLQISNSTTQTLSISCTSPTLSAGQIWKAYPMGTRYSYKILAEKWAWDEFGPAYPICHLAGHR